MLLVSLNPGSFTNKIVIGSNSSRFFFFIYGDLSRYFPILRVIEHLLKTFSYRCNGGYFTPFKLNYAKLYTKRLHVARQLLTLVRAPVLLLICISSLGFRQRSPFYLLSVRGNFFKLSNVVSESIFMLEPAMLMRILVMSMNMEYFTGHRYMIKRLITIFSLNLPRSYFLNGVDFLVTGKIAIGGNARTRTLGYTWGVRAKSKSWLKGNRSFDIVYTDTGCLGLSLLYVS